MMGWGIGRLKSLGGLTIRPETLQPLRHRCIIVVRAHLLIHGRTENGVAKANEGGQMR